MSTRQPFHYTHCVFAPGLDTRSIRSIPDTKYVFENYLRRNIILNNEPQIGTGRLCIEMRPSLRRQVHFGKDDANRNGTTAHADNEVRTRVQYSIL